jgi:hypothetical protein
MRSLLLLAVTSLLLSASPAGAVDLDHNGLDDSIGPSDAAAPREDASVAIVDTGDQAVNDYANRLTAAGYGYTLITPGSDYSVLSLYDAVLLPVGHGSSCCWNTFNALADDYHRYVNDGGCLYIGQPNPYDLQGQQADITWAPYALRLYAFYDPGDCPPTIEDPNACETESLTGDDLPFPGDQALEVGPEWSIFSAGPLTGYPSLLGASYGTGHAIVELGHPSPGALCPYSDIGFATWFGCCLSGPVATESTTWGTLKALYRD